MRKLAKPRIILTVLLVLILLSSSAQAILQIEENIVFRTRNNNANWTLGDDFEFYRVEVNTTHLWMDKTYTAKHYTRYCIYVVSPSNSNFTVLSWFNSANGTAQLTITAPLSTAIDLRLYSPNLISASATGVTSYSWTSANQTLTMNCNTDFNTVVTISATVSETSTNISPENYAISITDMEGCGAWVFSEEAYYTFQAQYWDGDGYSDLDTCRIAFTDDVDWVNASYDVSSTEYTLESGADIVNLKAGTVTFLDQNLLQITFLIYFENTVLDTLNIELYMWCNDSDGVVDGWEIMETDYFSIYNLGGHSTLTVNDDAGRLTGGDVFDLYAYNDSWAQAYMTFRDLQHVKLLPTVLVETNPDWYNDSLVLTYSIDYCVDDVWVTGYSLVMRSYWTATLHDGGSVRWWNWTAQMWNRGSLVSEENIWMFFESPTGLAGNRTTRFWIDLWFNKVNASSTFGCRVNAYYYPMRDTANPWFQWLTGSNWGVDERFKKQLMLFEDLQDGNNDVLHTKEIDMVRLGFRIEWDINTTGTTQYAQVYEYDVFDLTLGGTPLEGIATPVFDESRVPVMPQGGFLGSLLSGLRWLGTYIADNIIYGGLNLWGHFVNFMDTIAGWLGFPNAFSNFITWLGSLGSWLTTSFSGLIDMLTAAFTFMTEWLTKFLNWIAIAFNTFADMVSRFWYILDNTWGGAQSVWDTIGMSNWILLGLILYPFFLLIIWEERGLDAMINHIRSVVDVLAFIARVFITVIQWFIGLISTIIESIPVVE